MIYHKASNAPHKLCTRRSPSSVFVAAWGFDVFTLGKHERRIKIEVYEGQLTRMNASRYGIRKVRDSWVKKYLRSLLTLRWKLLLAAAAAFFYTHKKVDCSEQQWQRSSEKGKRAAINILNGPMPGLFAVKIGGSKGSKADVQFTSGERSDDEFWRLVAGSTAMRSLVYFSSRVQCLLREIPPALSLLLFFRQICCVYSS